MRMSKTVVATALSFMMLGTGAIGVAAQQVGVGAAHAPAAVTLAQQGTKTTPPVASSPGASSQSAACIADQQKGNDKSEVNGQKAKETEISSAQENTAADPDNLQCGDQQQDSQANAVNGMQALAAPGNGTVTFLRAQVNPSAQAATPQTGTAQANNGTENEQAAESETGGTNDQATDGVVCDQQGQHEGNNVGC